MKQIFLLWHTRLFTSKIAAEEMEEKNERTVAEVITVKVENLQPNVIIKSQDHLRINKFHTERSAYELRDI